MFMFFASGPKGGTVHATAQHPCARVLLLLLLLLLCVCCVRGLCGLCVLCELGAGCWVRAVCAL